MSDKYAAIRRDRDRYPIRFMCAALGVSASGFYAAESRWPSTRATDDAGLLVAVRAAHTRSHRRYGAPRVHRDLRTKGIRIAKKRVARLMRLDGLIARRCRRRAHTTDSAHASPIAPNHRARRFAVATVEGVDRVWVSDMTYVPTRVGWLYLAVVLDLCSRRVIGWAMRHTLAEILALDSLKMALTHRRPARGLVHHSDRGSQYAGDAYQALLAAYGSTCSMSRKGNCWDNAVAESFFATLEHELLAESTFHSREEAYRAIFEFIEVGYNRQRQHSTLGYLSPVAYEERLSAA